MPHWENWRFLKSTCWLEFVGELDGWRKEIELLQVSFVKTKSYRRKMSP